MFQDLGIDVCYMADAEGTMKSHRLFVSGETLLSWANGASNAAYQRGATSAPAASGRNKDEAIPIRGYDDWLGAWYRFSESRGQDLYFSIGDRIIKKHKRQVSKTEGHADGCYVADLLFSGTDDTIPSGNIWHRSGGASYREFGKFMHQKDSESALEGVVWSQRVASKLRMVLKGKAGGYTGGKCESKTDHSKATRADAVSALPLLSAAMFLAEPTRNHRAWVIGLMMLDLLGAEYVSSQIVHGAGEDKLKEGKFYTLQRTFVHPSRLDDSAWKDELNYDTDQAPEAWVDRQMGTRPTTGKRLAKRQRSFDSQAAKMKAVGSPAVEGIYPPSPKWSARSSDNVSVADDYVQQKEVSVLCRWAEQEFNPLVGGSSVLTATALKSGERVGRRDAMSASFSGESGMDGFKAELERTLKSELIERRAGSFDSPGMLFR